VLEEESGVLEEESSSSRDVNILKLLPWCGVKVLGCNGIKYNGGLYTQCRSSVSSGVSSEYCGGCVREKRKNGGVLSYGSVVDRLSCGIMEYKDVKGRSPTSYTKVMKKHGLNREEVERVALCNGIVVPACHFEEVVSRRGRPRKEKEVVSSPMEKKKRGRPRKE
jgi:hypothetical protein